MGSVTYISMTEEKLQEVVSQSVKTALSAYEERLLKDDIRGVPAWAKFLNVDRRTIIRRIENGDYQLISRSPYRISKYEILKYQAGKT